MFPTTIKLSQYFRVPEYVAGYLEWGTGIIRINTDYEKWQQYCGDNSSQPPEHFRPVIATITHESYHFLQIAVTGFMYRFALSYFEAMRESISTHTGESLTDDTLYRFLTNPPKVSEKVGSLLQLLHRKGPSGVTSLDIIESAAFFYEHRTHFINLTPQGYNRIIQNESPPKEYYAAYREAERVLGPEAFDKFLISTVLSLCFEEPQDIFPAVLQCVKAVKGPYQNASNIPSFIMSIQDLMKEHAVLGTSMEYMNNSGKKHPIYHKALLCLNDMADMVSPVDLVSRAGAMSIDTARASVQPLVFNGNRILVPPAFTVKYGEENTEQELQVLVLLAAMFMAHGSEIERPTRFFDRQIKKTTS